ncbi:hypothetical protein [Maribellus sp. YY47]|uniref:hypothetical protein n=1 Tax=Maribellus sp. YY47 TaxID=2929486 RepID=UPI002001A89B|nr:hypothetical protein [Maribellus sp. YY47]MCK3684461.1 hypothetical protein [Maribellus sp. YY47]
MEEPYWEGTLDATCEGKNEDWRAFQGFVVASECNKNKKYPKRLEAVMYRSCRQMIDPSGSQGE